MWYMAYRRFPTPEASWARIGCLRKFGVEEPATDSGKYLVSVYFANTILSMGGFGDFEPQNRDEFTAVMVIQAYNYSVITYIIGTMTMIISRMDADTSDFRRTFRSLNAVRARGAAPARPAPRALV